MQSKSIYTTTPKALHRLNSGPTIRVRRWDGIKRSFDITVTADGYVEPKYTRAGKYYQVEFISSEKDDLSLVWSSGPNGISMRANTLKQHGLIGRERM